MALLGEPIRSGEGGVIADLDFTRIDRRKQVMDSRGHYSRPELLSLLIYRSPTAHVHERACVPSRDLNEPRKIARGRVNKKPGGMKCRRLRSGSEDSVLLREDRSEEAHRACEPAGQA
jgi:hypothetical protein